VLIGLSDTPGSPPPVGVEYSRAVDLQTSTFRSCDRCTGQLAIAARPGRVVYTRSPFEVQHGIAPKYLGPPVNRVTNNLPGRQALRSAGTNLYLFISYYLCVFICGRSPFKLSTISTRVFPAAGSHVRNSLPADSRPTSAPSPT